MEIAEKIRKLIAHELSARRIGNVAEAESFAAKIQDLLLRHKLTMDEVELKSDPIGQEASEASRSKKHCETWNFIIAVAAAEACMCEAIQVARTNAAVFVGRSQDRGVAISIWRFLSSLAIELLAADLPKIAKRSRMHPLRARERYLKGFATAIHLRLRRERARVVEDAGEAGLIRVESEHKALQEYKANALKTRPVHIARTRDSLAFRVGFARGAEAPLRKQHTLEARNA